MSEKSHSIPLVKDKIDNGRSLLARLRKAGIVVRAACWVKPIEEDRWTLYIATPSVDEKGTLEAYRQLRPVLRSLGDDWITGSDVTLVGEKHPMVRDALDILRRFPHNTPIRSPLSLHGGIPVEEVYVYPPGEVEVTIYGMVFRSKPGGALEPNGALHLSFEPHNPNSTLTVESMGNRAVYEAETGIDSIVAAPEGATLERNESGQMVLAWDLHDNRVQSDANEVWALAKLVLHGFRLLRESS
jgi:hypothetical protein